MLDNILLSRIIRLSINYRREKFTSDATTILYEDQSMTIVTMFNKQLPDMQEGYNPFSLHYSGITEVQYYDDGHDIISVRMLIASDKIIILGKIGYDEDMSDGIVVLNKIRDNYWIGTIRSENDYIIRDLYITKIGDDVINVIKILSEPEAGQLDIVTDGLNTMIIEDGESRVSREVTSNMKMCYKLVSG